MLTIIRSEHPIIVQVTAIFRMRVPGLYGCTVTTDRITNTSLTATEERNITGKSIRIKILYLLSYSSTVTESPADLTYSRDANLISVRLDWSSSEMINTTIEYQLFITNSDGITTSNVTSNDYIDLSLQLDSEYNITLVATGEDLPSDILTITVPQGIVVIIIIIIVIFNLFL